MTLVKEPAHAAAPIAARSIPERLDGEVRRTAPGSKYVIDHRHDGIEFALVTRGTGSCWINGEAYDLKPGTLVWIGAGQRHRLVRTPALEMWVVLARQELMKHEWLGGIGLHPVHILPGEELVELDRLLGQVAQDSDDAIVYNAGIRYALYRAWRASTDTPPAAVRPMHPSVSRALLILRENGGVLSLSQLAKAAGIGAPYLSRLLVDNTGLGFLDWRNRVRLEHFLKAYRDGDNLLRLSFEAGFGSYSRFHAAFTELMNCSPSEWAKQADKGRAIPTAAGMPETPVVSSRLKWTRFVPLLSPAVEQLLGTDFGARLLAVQPRPVAGKTAGEQDLDGSLPPSERHRIAADLASVAPNIASELGDILDEHDFAGTFSGLAGEYSLSPARLSTSLTAMIGALWTVIHQASDPSAESIGALSRQIIATLRDGPQPLAPDAAQAAHSALICHFVILYHALQAARARGGPAREQLSALAGTCAKSLTGHDLQNVMLTGEGLIRGR